MEQKNSVSPFNKNLYMPLEICNIPRNIKIFFRSLKWSVQRIKRGYSDCDVWDFDQYITRVLADGLMQLALTAHGYPGSGEYSTMDSWEQALIEASNYFYTYAYEDALTNPFKDEFLKIYDKETEDCTEEDEIVLDNYFEVERELEEIRNDSVVAGFEWLGQNIRRCWD